MSFLLRIVRGHHSLLKFSGKGGNGLFILAQGFTWTCRCGTIYLSEDPAVVFSWILCQNPEEWGMNCSWHQGCIQWRHLGVYQLILQLVNAILHFFNFICISD